MNKITKVAKNNKGTEIEYGLELEERIREVYKLNKDEEISDELVFSFFASAYSNAINKGYGIEE